MWKWHANPKVKILQLHSGTEGWLNVSLWMFHMHIKGNPTAYLASSSKILYSSVNVIGATHI